MHLALETAVLALDLTMLALSRGVGGFEHERWEGFPMPNGLRWGSLGMYKCAHVCVHTYARTYVCMHVCTDVCNSIVCTATCTQDPGSSMWHLE